MARKCSSWIFCLSSSLGIYFGITIFFLFTFVYHNNYAGIWGLISAVFAGLCLHLHLLSSDNRLSGWYSAQQLIAIAAFSFICFALAIGFTSWYLIYAIYHHIPMLPVKNSYFLAAVWSGMTMKWTFALFLLSYRYSRILRYTTPFLIIQENA
ncbi:heme transporter hrg1-B [Folsomia candida]|uniref:Heme transporter hrg1-B n=1 Tax=Folsomia candida TaxID=158441 RepID=A0A226EN80_FOLCA|nr:heme transporter hrg1-B [Folsomia candida]XP_021946867.1 heme transporter hrg1-B [Folsomia candida]XP_021946869.1 heme transporter hrg1-B [Folsomia candida]OXA59123.1 Heme transporter hrg1-B [Folsomia candida]